MQPMHAFGAKPGDGRQCSECRGRPGFDLGKSLELPSFYDLANLSREIFADPGQANQGLAIGNHLGCALRQVLDRQRGAAIGANAKRIGPFDLE
jgi:hypothetical protein